MKVSLVAAVTVDGFIGKSDADLSTRWTSKDDAKFFRKFSKRVKHLVIGSKTFATFNRRIDGRKFYVYSRKSAIENKYDNDLELVTASPTELVARLVTKGVAELMVAGGSSIYTQFMKAGVVDEVFLTVEPLVFGQGVRLFNEELSVKLSLLEIIDLSDQTKVLHYKVVRNG